MKLSSVFDEFGLSCLLVIHVERLRWPLSVCANLRLRREVRAGDTHLEVANLEMTFKVLGTESIREEKRSKA